MQTDSSNYILDTTHRNKQEGKSTEGTGKNKMTVSVSSDDNVEAS